jgi:geranylgeranyl reductase family protein
MTRDVVIVGAGPAGAAAAASLVRRGRGVLLLDRHAFPRDKVCGDGIPPGTIELLGRIGVAEKIRAAGFCAVHRIRIGSPSGRTWETGFRAKRPGLEFYVAPRLRFDALLHEHAVECGAEFLRATATGPVFGENGCVTGVRVRDDSGEHEIRARAVIAADGATSAIARALSERKAPPHHRCVAIRAYADGFDVEPDTVEFYFDRRFVPGYAWVFPVAARCANVGVIMRADRFKVGEASLRELLDEFLAAPRMRGRSRAAALRDEATWQLPLAVDPWRARSFPGALLAGDAGGFVDPLTGEGIHFAVASGMIAADVVHEALVEGNRGLEILSTYDQRCRRAFGPLIQRSYRCHRWIARAPGILEPLFVAANAVGGLTRSWLNRVSTDFVLHP